MTDGERYGRDYSRDEQHYFPGYEPPGQEPAGHETPGHAAPGQDTPGYDAPGYGTPGYEAPGYGSPTPGSSGYETPGYAATGYPPPGYARQNYEGQGYEAQGYEAQGYAGQGYEAQGYAGQNYPSQGNPSEGHGYDAPTSPQSGYPPSSYPASSYPASSYPAGTYSSGTYSSPAYPAEPELFPDRAGGAGYRSPGAYGAPDADTTQQLTGLPRSTSAGRSPRDRVGAAHSAGRGPGDNSPRSHGRDRKGMPLWQELPLLLIIAFCLAVLIRTFLLQAFYIPSGSMENTLLVGDRVLVNKVVYDIREPARGEIVVFSGTDAWTAENPTDGDIGFFARVGQTLGDLVGISRPGEKDFIKRVVGLPGDRVSCCDVDGRVFVNGHPLNEEYVTDNAPLEVPPEARDCRARRFDEVVVEPGQIFVMGDHRLVSQDSRCQGQVPIENVIGRAFIIVWPSNRWTSLPAPETFQGVPPAVSADGPAPAGTSTVDVQATALAPQLLQLPLMLPIMVTSLLPWGHRVCSSRYRLIGRDLRRRLAE